MIDRTVKSRDPGGGARYDSLHAHMQAWSRVCFGLGRPRAWYSLHNTIMHMYNDNVDQATFLYMRIICAYSAYAMHALAVLRFSFPLIYESTVYTLWWIELAGPSESEYM